MFGFLVALENRAVIQAVIDTFLSGQLYLYAASVCGSIYYASRLDLHKQNIFSNIWTGIFIILCIALTSLYMGSTRSIDQTSYWVHAVLSFAFFVSSAFIYYVVLVRSQEPPPDIMESNKAGADLVIAGSEPNYD